MTLHSLQQIKLSCTLLQVPVQVQCTLGSRTSFISTKYNNTGTHNHKVQRARGKRWAKTEVFSDELADVDTQTTYKLFGTR